MENKKLTKKIDRIILDTATMAAINTIIHHVQTELGDLISINTKTIANFILRQRSALLSKEELAQLKNENHDIIRALKKATQEAIRSRQSGNELNYEDIQKILQTPKILSDVSEKARSRKKKEIAVESISYNNSDSDQNK